MVHDRAAVPPAKPTIHRRAAIVGHPCTPAKRLCLQREENIAMGNGRRCVGKSFSNDLIKLFQLMNSFFQRMSKVSSNE
ncbi:UNVERIFIED_CONTAM: hypothetical protein NY100_02805 [Prevotella sp. 15_C9]